MGMTTPTKLKPCRWCFGMGRFLKYRGGGTTVECGRCDGTGQEAPDG